VVRNQTEVFEATVDLQSGTVIDWRLVPGVQPAIQSTEWARAERITKSDDRWLAAMAARGYDDVSQIFCDALSPGYFGDDDEPQQRLIKMPCYDVEGTKTNVYGRPIEGIISVVDLNRDVVVRVIDTGIVPISKDSHRLDESTEGSGPLRPTTTESQARRFAVGGRAGRRTIEWQAWSFHVGFDPRFGPVLSLVSHRDGEADRMILYQGNLSEVFVPYMDFSAGWYFRSYMDSGEYGLGVLTSSLTPGIDCPEDSMFFAADLVSPVGRAYTRERAICVFERDTDAPLWRHREALNDTYEGRPATELVVRSIPSIGNYDYVVDWVFTQKGEIHINLGATGIDAVKGVDVVSMADSGAAATTASGNLVAPNLLAVHHDHYFSIRLDIDVDGPTNTFRRERLARVAGPPDHPRRSIWQLEPLPMQIEGALSARAGPELWRIENPNRRTSLGHRPSYQIQKGSSATSLLDEKDWPQRRAAFSSETLWITRQREGELFAAGQYPNQSPGGEGLSAYVDGEKIYQADLVAWYTIGFHHLTRPEDWPVLPTQWHSVRLRPYGFFTGNPGLRANRPLTDRQGLDPEPKR
jgi:primary-amine oxidase